MWLIHVMTGRTLSISASTTQLQLLLDEVWRGVDIFGDGQGPGVWREREYDPIINYWVTGDSVNKEKITLQQVETGADKKPTGGLSVVKYEF